VLGLVMNLYPLWFVAVGLFVLFQRLDDTHAWLLALMFGSFEVSAPYFSREAALHEALRGFGAAMAIGLGSLAPALFYAFFTTFPARSPIDRRLPWLKWVLLAAVAALAGPLAGRLILAGSPEPVWDILGRVAQPPISVALVVYQFATFLLGLAALLLNATRSADAEIRRKARVMLWGSVAGLGPIIVLNGVSMLLGETPPVTSGYPGSALPFWLWALSIIALLLWPLSFAYAVVKHRVLEIPWLLRRSARYLLVQRGFLVLVALVSLAASGLLVRLFTEVGARRGGIAAPVGAATGIVLGLGLAFTGSRVHRRVARRIDRAFFRESYDARLLLEELMERTREVESREELAGLLDQSLKRALRPARTDVFLAVPQGRLAHFGSEPLESLDPQTVLSSHLSGRLGPLVGPEAAALALEPLSPECVVPLPGRRGGLLGLVVLGPRLSEEPYSREDRALLAAVASQAGLTIEGIALAEQIADRIEAERRAAREMEIAREVQRKLLPQHSLRAARLGYAARCVQARAVGGDYWDALRLDADRLALVQADISGKGISAALLMANLQASLRSRPPAAFQDLPALLAGLNGQLCESTEPSRYATLFLSTWEDSGADGERPGALRGVGRRGSRDAARARRLARALHRRRDRGPRPGRRGVRRAAARRGRERCARREPGVRPGAGVREGRRLGRRHRPVGRPDAAAGAGGVTRGR